MLSLSSTCTVHTVPGPVLKLIATNKILTSQDNVFRIMGQHLQNITGGRCSTFCYNSAVAFSARMLPAAAALR